MPVACCNQPGFSAEKESHERRQAYRKSLKTKLLHAIMKKERQVNDMKINARMENFCHLPLAA